MVHPERLKLTNNGLPVKLVYHHKETYVIIMVPTQQIIMNSSYYYEYRENIHLGVKLNLA